MPVTEVIYYRELDGTVPVFRWLEEADRRDRRAVAKCAASIEMLRQQGYDLRRPATDYLRDGIYELRIRSGRVQYRILYFFHGQNAVVLTHGLAKEKKVPRLDIERAILRKARFQKAPAKHSFRGELGDG
jgi:phage-related protein